MKAGKVKCVEAVPENEGAYPESFSYDVVSGTLRVGSGEFSPLASAVFDFEVSGLKVVQSWLKYRMKKGAGKKSSPLDDVRPEVWNSRLTTELLELLWVLEKTVALSSQQEDLLERIVSAPCFEAEEFPAIPSAFRKPPSLKPRRKQVSRKMRLVPGRKRKA